MKPLLEIEDLRVTFPGHEAVRGVNLTLAQGETLALVGESGCGKSATALALMRLVASPGRVTGRIGFEGVDLMSLDNLAMRQLRGVSTRYASPRGAITAVKNVSLDIYPGETLGLVGESGCGKSTLSRTILRLLPSAAGQIRFAGEDVTHLNAARLTALRRQVQMIFQDPFASLNPRQTIQRILELPLIVHGVKDRGERQRLIGQTLDRVGLPRNSLARYPHEFSGGQRQRIGIARALVVKPALVICDEPVSALDVSIQAQILNLLVELKSEMQRKNPAAGAGAVQQRALRADRLRGRSVPYRGGG